MRPNNNFPSLNKPLTNKMKLQIFALLVLAAAAPFAAAHPFANFVSVDNADLERPVRYDGDTVVQLRGLTDEQQRLLDSWNVDVWGEGLGADAVVHVTSRQLQQIRELGLDFSVVNGALQASIDEETERLRTAAVSYSFDSADWFTEFHRYSEGVAWFQALATANPQFIKYVPGIGKTVQGRDIFAVHITSPKALPSGAQKPKVFITALHHAREWISGSTIQYVANSLVSEYSSNADTAFVLDNIEFILIPFVNSDGYEYTWTTDRLWRKNRALNSDKTYGVDLNRNYDDGHWGGEGASATPSSETFRGPKAASEPETQTIQNYFKKFDGQVIAGLDLHSYSQLILRPYGWSRTNAPDEAIAKQLGDGVASVIKSISGKTYTSERSWELYITSGTAQDYYYSRKAHGFTWELRPTGSNPGFVIPPSEIIPTGKEIFPAVVYFAKFALQNPVKK